jgi:hypothetical protein
MSAAPKIGATWQERFEQKKQRDALIDQLRALDTQRDALRAAIADASLLCAEKPWGIRSDEEEAAWFAEQQEKVDRRAVRRAAEAPWAGVIPPGPWDADLDKHLRGPVVWDLGDGYTGRLFRNMDGGWNYYITVPAGNSLWGKSCDDDALPCYFTYSAEEDDGGWTFGNCHDEDGGDVVPKIHYRKYRADNYFSGEPINRLVSLPNFEEVPFLTAEKVQEQVWRIKDRMVAVAGLVGMGGLVGLEQEEDEDAPPYDVVGGYKIGTAGDYEEEDEDAPPYDVVGGYKIGTAGDYEVEIEAEMEAAKPRSWSSVVKGH